MLAVRISLVVPTLNAGPLLDEVLASILALQGTRFDELVAIDSGSTDGTVPRLQRAGFTVLSIDKRDFDHGGTRDLGIRAALAGHRRQLRRGDRHAEQRHRQHGDRL